LAVNRAPILVLRALGLGDALTAVPALRGLRRRYPDRLLLLAGPIPISDWLRRQGVVDAVLPLTGLDDPPPGRRLGHHIAVNLHGCGPQSHRLLIAGRPDELIAFDCPAAGVRTRSQWRTAEHEVRRWCRLIEDAGGECDPSDLRLELPRLAAHPVDINAPAGPAQTPGLADAVVLHPGAASGARQWPPDRWAMVARTLVRYGFRIVLTGSTAESHLCRVVAHRVEVGCTNTSGSLSLDELATVVASARLLLSGDTGVAHLATALGCPSVTLFGPTPPDRWGPLIDPELHRVLYAGKGIGNPHADQTDPGLLRITVAEVVAAALSLVSVGDSPKSQTAFGRQGPD
jgi:ADP-heptose:LPS heptosyltransferase